MEKEWGRQQRSSTSSESSHCLMEKADGSWEYFLLLCWLQKAKKESATCDSSPLAKHFVISVIFIVSRLSVWPHSNAAAKKRLDILIS